MFSIFNNNQTPSHASLKLPNLDNSLYPLNWDKSTVNSSYDMLLKMLKSCDASGCYQSGKTYSKLLQNNAQYQAWINFTVYGRYIQRSFTAFSMQSEDSFNAKMPELLKNELLRHAQFLPHAQVLFLGGPITKTSRQQKHLIATLNPFHAYYNAQQYAQQSRTATLNLNYIVIQSDQVKAFAVKHNKRTREAIRNEIIVLDFKQLLQIKEETLSKRNLSNQINDTSVTTLIKHYLLR